MAAAKKTKMSKIKVELRRPSKDEKKAFVGGTVDGTYKGFTIDLKEEVEIPSALVPNLKNAYVMAVGESDTLEPTPRYIVTEV